MARARACYPNGASNFTIDMGLKHLLALPRAIVAPSGKSRRTAKPSTARAIGSEASDMPRGTARLSSDDVPKLQRSLYQPF